MNELVRITNILEKEFDITNDMNEQTELIDELGFDSISLVELASFIGSNIGIKINASEAANWTTIDSIINTIDNIQKQ